MTSERAQATSRMFSVWLLALGLSIGVGLCSAAWMIEGGYRHDLQGTGPANAEMVLGWGGLLVAAVLFLVSVIFVTKPYGRSPRRSVAESRR